MCWTGVQMGVDSGSPAGRVVGGILPPPAVAGGGPARRRRGAGGAREAHLCHVRVPRSTRRHERDTM